jgi:GNAT superfamily N-acetyltransferase
MGWVCGDLWFLAQLFVSPDHQGRSIGNELLKRTFEMGEHWTKLFDDLNVG